MTQGHNLQGVCSLSAWLGAGPPLPHRGPQQLPQPRGVWPLLHEGRYIWGNLNRNKFIRIIGGPGLEPLSPSLWGHSGAGGTRPAELIHDRQTFIVISVKLIALFCQNVLLNVLSECTEGCMSVTVGVRGQVWATVSGHWPLGRGSEHWRSLWSLGTGQWLTHWPVRTHQAQTANTEREAHTNMATTSIIHCNVHCIQ